MTTTATHAFTASTEDRRRCTCGKSRNTSVHGYDAKARKAAAAPLAEPVLRADGNVTIDPRTPHTEEAHAEAIADARSRRAAELAEAVNAGTLTFDAAAAELLGGKAEAYRAETTAPTPREAAESDLYDAVRDAETATAPLAVVTVDGEETSVEVTPTVPMRSLWVAAAFVPIILADTTPERATLVAKVDASTPNNRGGRTVRLTEAEARELDTIGVEIAAAENGGGRMTLSSRTMRARLARLWAWTPPVTDTAR